MYPRYLLNSLRRAIKHFPVIFLNGPRQAGKSTMAELIKKEISGSRYLTFDDLNVLTAAQFDPVGFVDEPKDLVILDEIQRVPELFLPIKRSVDQDRRPGRFLLTGSANVLLLPNLADSLAGRMQIFTLYPLSAGELGGAPSNLIDLLFDPDKHDHLLVSGGVDVDLLSARLVTGGYPEVQGFDEDLRRAWFQGYVTTLLQRDVREIANIDGLRVLPNLLSLLATRLATLLNVQEISRSSGLPATTLKRYLTLLHAFFLIDQLPAWSNHLGKRLIRSPKLHLLDTGLLCHLLGLNEVGLMKDRAYWGRVLETYVVTECLKLAGWSKASSTLFHYRTVAGAEVDLVLESHNRQVVGIEVKAAQSINIRDLRGLKSLAADAGESFVCGVIFYLGDQAIRMGERLYAIPLPI